MNTTETIICSTTILATPSVWDYFWYNFLISQWSAENKKSNDKDDIKQVSAKETIATFKNLGL